MPDLIGMLGGIPAIMAVLGSGALAFVFRSRLIGAFSGGGGNLAIVAILVAGGAGFLLGQQSTQGTHKRYTRAVLKQSQAFLDREAAILNRSATMNQYFLAVAYDQSLLVQELNELVREVATATDEGRNAAIRREQAIRSGQKETIAELERRIQQLDTLIREDLSVETYTAIPVPDGLRRFGRVRDNDAGEPGGVDADVPGE